MSLLDSGAGTILCRSDKENPAEQKYSEYQSKRLRREGERLVALCDERNGGEDKPGQKAQSDPFSS